MGKLPRYQRMGVTARQIQSTDFAGFRGQAQTASTLTQAFDRMGGFLETKAKEQAKDAGLERVRSEGAQPLLEQLQAQGGPRGLEERTAYEAANRIARAEIASEAELEITRILDEGQAKGQSYSTIQAQLKDVSDGFSAALSDIDPVSAGLLRTQLKDTTAKAELRYSKWWTGEIAKQNAKRRNVTAANSADTILKDSISDGKTLAQIDLDIKKAEERLLDMGTSLEVVQSWSDSVKKAAYKENRYYTFNTASLDEQAEMLKKMETKPIFGMSLGETQTFRKSLRSDYNARLQVSRGEAASITSDVNEQARILALGGVPSPEKLLDLEERAGALGDLGAGARDAIGELQFSVEKSVAYRRMTPQELTAEVNAIKLGLEGMGGSGVDTKLEAETLKVAEAYLASAQKAVSAAATARKDSFQPIVKRLEGEVKDFQDLVDANQNVKINDIIKLMKRVGEVPVDLRGDLPDDVEVLDITAKTASDMRQMSPIEAAGYIKSIFAGIENIGGPGIDTQAEIKSYKLAQKMLSGMEAELKKDQLSYAARVGTKGPNGEPIEITPIDLTSPDNTFESIQKRRSDAKTVAARYSRPVVYLTPQEKTVLSDMIRESDRGQIMSYLGTITQGFEEDAPDVLAEISKTSPEFAGIGGLVVAGRMDSANMALRGMEAVEAGFKPIEFTAANTDLKFNQMTAEALLYQPIGAGIARKVATAIYADIAKDEEVFNEDLWEEAINLSLGGDGDERGGIQEIRGSNTYLPPEASRDDVTAALKAITPESIAAASEGQIISEEFARKISGRGLSKDSNYRLVAHVGGNYLLEFGQSETGAPLYVFDQSGSELTFSILDLIEASK